MKYVLPLLLALSLVASAKENPTIVVWPSQEQPVLRFAFGKFAKVGSVGTQNSYTVEVTAENLWSKPIPSATFETYFFGKDNIRMGSGYISVRNLGVHETVKFTMPFSTTGGQPATLKLQALDVPKELGPAAPPRKIRLTVYSVPSGANLKLDGEDVGVTPKQVELAMGKHTLQFSRNGYHNGSFPLEVGPDDVSGGTVSYELGSLAHDTVEMRDGSTLIGDVESMDATAVVVRVAGNLQSVDRNQVKRILLVQREPVPEAQAPQPQQQ